MICNRFKRRLLSSLPSRFLDMAHENNPSLGFLEKLQRRQNFTHTKILRHHSILHRDIEVAAHEDFDAFKLFHFVEVFHWVYFSGSTAFKSSTKPGVLT